MPVFFTLVKSQKILGDWKLKEHIPPKPSSTLFENLFNRRDRMATLSVISEGLSAVTKNAGYLLEEAEILASAEKYPRAEFLVATADEEIAKAYILLDMCRLDFDKQGPTLRRLCKAFYKHVEKHAYYTIVNDSFIRDMQNAMEMFHIELRRYWPSGGPESGEPDMPHQTYFNRELNLYVDFIEYNQAWNLPAPSKKGYVFFDDVFRIMDKKKQALNRLVLSQDQGLYSVEALEVLNDVFREHYLTEMTSNEEMDSLFTKLKSELGKLLGGDAERFSNTAYFEWSLYHFLTNVSFEQW